MEDNNLWTRQLLNLVIQLSLALYVFWKSYDLLDTQLMVVAVPIFIAGIIKYGERIWALKNGSRDSLDGAVNLPPMGDVLESCALRSAFASRGFLVGRKLYHLDAKAQPAYLNCFDMREDKLEFELMDLSMIYDMLYTKTVVLQTWTGRVFRGIALVAMMVGFVLFWVDQHLHTHRTMNAAITYMLFLAAICVELYSIFLAIASPWTRASFLRCLSIKLACCFPSQGLPNPSMGQFSPVFYSLSTKSRRKLITNVLEALGLEKHWRNFWYVDHVEDKAMAEYIVGLFNFEHNPSGERSQQLDLGEELKSLLTLPFEHVLLCLHIFTEMHLSTLADGASSKMNVLAAQCRVLSNYLMYLMAVCPSMLPVSRGATQDVLHSFTEWVRENHGKLTDKELYVSAVINNCFHQRSPFKKEASEDSLKDMKELWARLLIYAAGKCPMELHARQLGDGLELLTVVGSLLAHCTIGDVGSRKLDLLATSPGHKPQVKSVAVQKDALFTIATKDATLYAFEFSNRPPDAQVLQPRPQSTQAPCLYVEAWAGDKPGKQVCTPLPSDFSQGVVSTNG
uniref:Uncharacterized protein n=1 Tax=Avena sativa TaxID=4498 RepID=A0ACD6AS38_AVESA